MALPTVTKTWQRSLCNQQLSQGTVAADNKLLFLNVLNALLGFGTLPWTVDYSCSGTTAGTVGDGVNRITSVSNVLIGTNTSAAHSWVVLKQSGISSGFRLLLSASSTNGYLSTSVALRVVVSWSAGFTGGTTTTDPTATDSTTILDCGSTSNAWVWAGSAASTTSYRYSAMQSTDGACTNVVITTTASNQFHLALNLATNPVTGWTAPTVAVLISNGAAPTNAAGYIKAPSTVSNISFGGVGYSAGLLGLTGPGSVANEIDNNWPISDMHIIGTTTGARGDHGLMTDLWYGSTGVATADSYNAAGSLQFVQFGSLVYSWDGATTVTLS